MEKTINLSDVVEIDHPSLFKEVRNVIKEKNLEYVNAHTNTIDTRETFYNTYIKRIIDIGGASVALLLTAPANAGLALCTFLDVGRPVFFRQKRIGKEGKPFVIIKFRNMTNETDENGDLLPPNMRVTKFGKFVRKTSLDELLNFYSVLKGDMSLIGPRPLLIEYTESYSDRHAQRHLVKPGLECPAIIPGTSRSDWKSQFENDVYYAENVSFALDVKLIIKLFSMVFNKNQETRENALKGSFLGYERDGSCIDSTAVPIEYYNEAVNRLKKANNNE